MDGLNLAALTQKASKKKILTIPKDGGLFNGLLLYKRMRQFKKQVYLGIGFRINARSLESLKTLSNLTTGISKYVVLSKPFWVYTRRKQHGVNSECYKEWRKARKAFDFYLHVQHLQSSRKKPGPGSESCSGVFICLQ